MGKQKPLFSYATVCGLLLYSEGHGTNGYNPFPMLGQLYREDRSMHILILRDCCIHYIVIVIKIGHSEVNVMDSKHLCRFLRI